MTVQANPIPTNDELKNALLEAQDALGETRADVFEGKASADDLAKAESAVAFAKARLEGAEEARHRRRQRQFEERVPEIVEELKALKPMLEELKAKEEAIRKAMLDYRDLQVELHGEVQAAHMELVRIRDWDRTKSILKTNNVSVSLGGGSLSVDGTQYGSVAISQLLTNLGVEVARPASRPVAQRPPRRKKEAA